MAEIRSSRIGKAGLEKSLGFGSSLASSRISEPAVERFTFSCFRSICFFLFIYVCWPATSLLTYWKCLKFRPSVAAATSEILPAI